MMFNKKFCEFMSKFEYGVAGASGLLTLMAASVHHLKYTLLAGFCTFVAVVLARGWEYRANEQQ